MILTKKGNIVTTDSEDHPPNSEHNKPASSQSGQRQPTRALHATTPEGIRVRRLQCNQMLPAFRCVSSEAPVCHGSGLRYAGRGGWRSLFARGNPDGTRNRRGNACGNNGHVDAVHAEGGNKVIRRKDDNGE